MSATSYGMCSIRNVSLHVASSGHSIVFSAGDMNSSCPSLVHEMLLFGSGDSGALAARTGRYTSLVNRQRNINTYTRASQPACR